MNDKPADPLARVLLALQQAGLDVTVGGVLDSIWLAMQPGFRLRGGTPSVETATAEPSLASNQPAVAAPPTPTPPAASSTKDAGRADREMPKPDRKGGLFGGGAEPDGKDALPASPLRVPAGSALPGKLPLSRSLRPLRKWYRNPQYMLLNEDATVEATAEARGLVVPVMEAQRERWYELVIVSDSEPSMDLWFETMAEFEQMARIAGVFRDVRRFRLAWDAGGKPMLEHPDASPVRAARLAQTNVRRLVFVMTNGTGGHWTDGRMADLLALWSKQCSVAVVQMLPDHMWRRSRTGEPTVQLRTMTPGTFTASLDAGALEWDDEFDGNEISQWRRIRGAVPVLPSDPLWMSRWARMQMGNGRAVPGLVIGNRPDRPRRPAAERTAEQWRDAVNAFIHGASDEARRLAVYLSQAPFTLPVARLVQSSMLGAAASHTQLAELLLGGLVIRGTPADRPVPHEWVEYRVHPSAAELLGRGLSQSDRERITDALGKHIEKHWGQPVDFRALVYDEQGRAAIPEWAQPFARVGAALLPPPAAPQRPTAFVAWASPEWRSEALKVGTHLSANGIRVLESGRHPVPRHGVFILYGPEQIPEIVLTDEMIRAIEFGLQWVRENVKSPEAVLAEVRRMQDSIAPPVTGAPPLQAGQVLSPSRVNAVVSLIGKTPAVLYSHDDFDGAAAVRDAVWLPTIRFDFGAVHWITKGGHVPVGPQKILVFDRPEEPVTVPDGCVAVLIDPSPSAIIGLPAYNVYEGPNEAVDHSVQRWRERLSEKGLRRIASLPSLRPHSASVLHFAAGIVPLDEERCIRTLMTPSPMYRDIVWQAVLAGLSEELRHFAGHVAAWGSGIPIRAIPEGTSVGALEQLGFVRRDGDHLRPTPLLEGIAPADIDWGRWNASVLSGFAPTDGNWILSAEGNPELRRNLFRLARAAGDTDTMHRVLSDGRWWKLRSESDGLEVLRSDLAAAGFDVPAGTGLEQLLAAANLPNAVRAAGEAYLKGSKRVPPYFILIAGTRTEPGDRVPEQNGWAAKAIAREMAARAFGLVCGLQPGCDRIAIETFVSAWNEGDVQSALRIVSFEPNAADINLPHGVQVALVQDQATASVRASDAVVMIGGNMQARLVYDQALAAGKPVFPLPAVSGASMQMFWRETEAGRISREVLWARPLEREADAPPLAAALLDDIQIRLQSDQHADILWVDDHPENNDAIVAEIRRRGVEVDTCTGTDEAIAKLQTSPYRIVISDIARGDNAVAGFELGSWVRSLMGPSMRLIYFAGFVDEARRLEIQEMNAEFYNQPRALLDALFDQRPEQWVRISGSGKFELPSAVRSAAELAGEAVARARMGLITGGWQGVDHVAGRAYAMAIENSGLPVDSWLLHIVSGAFNADLPMGKTEQFEWAAGLAESIRRASAVILIGGEGGTWQTFQSAMVQQRHTIPVADSGGDAERAWRLLRFAGGAESLRVPRLRLSGSGPGIEEAAQAFEHDLRHPVDLKTGAGAVVVDLVMSVLPMCEQYLREPAMERFEGIARKVRDLMRRWSEMPDEMVSALLMVAEWRVAGYFAFQVYPHAACVQHLLKNVSVEQGEIDFRNETRPLFQLLNALHICAEHQKLRRRLPSSVAHDFARLLEWLSARRNVDTGGQCKERLRTLLAMLSPPPA